MLVARRADALTALAEDLQTAYGIQTRTLVQDLMAFDAGDRILAAAADLEVGLYVSNAGADGGGSSFTQNSVERWQNVINMNVRTVTQTTHGFGARMSARGRGGILLMSSLAALGGQPWLAMYSATKAFEMVFAEALWAELGEAGVDMLVVLAPGMDTPTFRRGVEGTNFDLSNVFDPDQVVQDALALLPSGPLLIFPYGPDADAVERITQERRDRLLAMAEIGKSLMPKT
jgi:short-subunit dehydrogenase